MTIYYYIYSILLFFALFIQNGNPKRTKRITSFVFFLLTVFLAIRFKVGNDYEEYFTGFLEISRGNVDRLEGYYEPGFILFYQVFDNPRLFFAILILISFFCLYKVFCFFGRNHIFVSILLYFSLFLIVYNIHLVRQGVAISIVAYSFIYLYQKKYIYYVLFVLLAANFHKSALIVLPFTFLTMIRFSKNQRYVILLISLVIFVVITFFREQVFYVLYQIPVTRRFAEVYNNMEYSSSYGLSLGLLFDIFLFIFVNSRHNLSLKQRFLLNIFMCAVFINIAFNAYSVALRLGYYFRFSSVFMFILLFKIKPRFLIYAFMIVYSYYYLNANLTKGNAVLDYKTIFTDEHIYIRLDGKYYEY